MTACNRYSVNTRLQTAEHMTAKHAWQVKLIHTDYFSLQAYLPTIESTGTLTVYIEGDGLAWINKYKVSSDPTPVNPVALKLALADQFNSAVYLARPCQYVRDQRCDKTYWTDGRFSPNVISAMDQAVEQLKHLFSAEQVQLIGFSGGGAVAALLAARRNDVSRLITVAGNLDHAMWTKLHGVSALSDSLNPANHIVALQNIPQVHFVGSEDKVVPIEVAQSFQAKFLVDKPIIRAVESANHTCCWQALWPELLANLSSSRASDL